MMTPVRELVAGARKWAHRLRASGDYGPHVAELLDRLADALEERDWRPQFAVDEMELLHELLDDCMGDTDLLHAEDISPEFRAYRKIDAALAARKEIGR